MNQEKDLNHERRKALKFLGIGAAVVPLAALSACSGGDAPSEPAAKAVEPKMEEKADEVAEAVTETVEEAAEEVTQAAASDLPVLANDDPTAKALGYVQDASTVDPAKYPRYADGQACSNCALYMGGDAPQGACSIFPGKAVMAGGWCSVYAPKA